jgi:hypothetical protein
MTYDTTRYHIYQMLQDNSGSSDTKSSINIYCAWKTTSSNIRNNDPEIVCLLVPRQGEVICLGKLCALL